MQIDLSIMDFADRVRLLRRLKGLTRTELAQQINISYNYIFKIENKQKINPSMKIILALAKVFDIDAGELLGDK